MAQVRARAGTKATRNALLATAVAALLAACAQGSGPSGTDGGTYRQKVGRPYQINGIWYYPQPDAEYDRVGIASWYGEPFHGRQTANGETYDMDQLTAAHTTLPLPTFVEVTNLENNRSIVVKVNDRGPFVDGRLIDMSRAAARELGFVDKGLARVRVRAVDPPPGVTIVAPKPTAPAVQTASLPRPVAMETASLPPPVPASDAPAPVTRLVMPPELNAAPAGMAPIPNRTPQEAAPAQDVAPVQTMAPVAASPGGGRFRIQAGVFGDLANARRLQRELAGIGPVEVKSLQAGDRTLHRVRVGPYPTQDTASAALDAVRANGLRDALIIVE